jgi:hypothetical protein
MVMAEKDAIRNVLYRSKKLKKGALLNDDPIGLKNR